MRAIDGEKLRKHLNHMVNKMDENVISRHQQAPTIKTLVKLIEAGTFDLPATKEPSVERDMSPELPAHEKGPMCVCGDPLFAHGNMSHRCYRCDCAAFVSADQEATKEPAIVDKTGDYGPALMKNLEAFKDWLTAKAVKAGTYKIDVSLFEVNNELCKVWRIPNASADKEV